MAETDINTHIVLVMGWIRKGEKLLMAQRKSDDPQAGGQWALPGGKVDLELGENIIEDTLRREISEEVGLEIGDKFTYINSRAFIRSSGHHVVGISFLVDYKSGEAQPLDGQQQVKWLTLDEVEQIIGAPNGPTFLKPQLEILRQLI